MRKRILTVVLVSVLTLSVSTNALAVSYGETANENNTMATETSLMELWEEGRDTFI